MDNRRDSSVTLPSSVWETIEEITAKSYSENKSACITELIKDGILSHINKEQIDRKNYKETVQIVNKPHEDYGDSIYEILLDLTDEQLFAYGKMLRNQSSEIERAKEVRKFEKQMAEKWEREEEKKRKKEAFEKTISAKNELDAFIWVKKSLTNNHILF